MNTAYNLTMVKEKQVLDLLGVALDGYKLVEKIGEGAFSVVYRGENAEGDVRAFKVARPEASYGPAATGSYPSEALVFFTGAIGKGKPDCADLLRKQIELIKAVRGNMIDVENFNDSEQCYLRMPFIAGKTLRQVMDNGAVSIDTMIALADALAATFTSGEKSHGDLKPENILIDGAKGEKVVLTDPGYFGSLRTASGQSSEMRITTRVYYPQLVANDFMAFGLVLLEMVLHKNILASRTSLTEIETTGVGSGLVEQIVYLERNHNYTWSAIATLGGKGQHAQQLAKSAFDPLILKLLGLQRFADQALNTGLACSSWAEVATDLRALKQQGVAQVS